MEVSINYEDALAEIDHAIANLPKQLEGQERAVLSKIGQSVKKHVKSNLKKSDIESRLKNTAPSNYDKSRPYVHMKDDVRFSNRKDKNGDLYVSIRGGKYTAFKWKPVNDGHYARDKTTFVSGNYFMNKAIAASEGEVNQIIDNMIKKVVG